VSRWRFFPLRPASSRIRSIETVLDHILAGNRSGGLHLVTGTGKTLVAARLIDEPARVGAEASSQEGRGTGRARRRKAGGRGGSWSRGTCPRRRSRP